MGQRSRAVGRAERSFGIARHSVDTVLGHPFADQFEAGDDAGQQVVEVVGDAAGQAAQCLHFLQLHQLRLSAFAHGHFMGQLAGGVVQPGQVRAFTVTVLGDVLDEHQAQARGLIRRKLPLGLAYMAMHLHAQGALPALAGHQVLAQAGQRRFLPVGKAFVQLLRVAIVLNQVAEGLVAFMHLQLGVHHGNRRRHAGEDFAKACLALAQCALGVAHAQQGAQGGQQHVGVDGVNQVGVGTGVQPSNDVATLDRRGRHMNHRQQGRAWVLTQQPDNVEAAHVRQVHVQDQGVDLAVADQRQALAARAGLQYLIPVHRQPPAHGIAGGNVVIDDQQAHIGIHSVPSGARASGITTKKQEPTPGSLSTPT